MSNLTETPHQDPKAEWAEMQPPVEAVAEEEEAVAAWMEREEELRHRYCDDPFCACTRARCGS